MGSEITAANDIRIKIKTGTNATFDITKTSLTLGGTASAKASGTVTYPDSKTLLIDVTSNFTDGQTLVIPGLYLVGGACGSGPSGAKSLQWSVDNGTTYNDGFASTGITVTKTATTTPPAEVPTVVSEKLVSLGFKLKWDPASAVSLNENSIVFDADTLFKTADLKSVNTSVPGEAIISFFSSNSVLVEPSAAKPLVKLAVQLSAAAGSKEVAFTVTDVDVIREVSVDGSLNYESSTNFTAIDAGKITFATQDKLRVLSTEAIDSTHVLVRFSDLLQGTGSAVPNNTTGTALFTKDSTAVVGTFTTWNSGMVGGSIKNNANGVWYTISAVADAANLTLSSKYAGDTTGSEAFTITGNYGFDNGLTVSDLASGYLSGYDQKTVILTTSDQTAGTAYTLGVLGTAVKGNTQAGLDPNYTKARLFGYSGGAAATGAFSILSAQATGYNKVELTFSDAVAAASVNKTGFKYASVSNVNFGVETAVSDVVANGNKVVVTVPINLTKGSTTIITAGGVRRDSDNALLGLGRIAVAGFKSGPHLTGAALNSGTLTLSFDEPIQVQPNVSIGQIVPTDDHTHTLLDLTADKFTVNVDKIVVANMPATTSEKNYIFVADVSKITNATGQFLDPAFGRATFWGVGTTAGSVALGAVEVTRKDAVELTKGTLDFTGLTVANAELFEINNVSVWAPIVNFTLSLNSGKLRVVTGDPLDPDMLYVLRLKNGAATLGVATFSVPYGFEMVSAQAMNKRQIMVTFSDNVDQDTVALAKFKLDPDVTISSATVQSGFKQVLLQLGADLGTGAYTVRADTGIAGIRSYTGGKILARSANVFAGYQAAQGQSTVRLESIDVNSSTLLTLHFSGALKADSVTPVNISIEKLLPSVGNLTVATATLKDPKTVELVTDQQDSDVNYFVSMNGVKDASGLPLGNNRVLNFLGFRVSAVVIRSLSPISVTNDAEKVVAVLGQNLDTVASARLGTTEVQVSQKTAGGLSLTIPSGFTAGVYDLNLVSDSGQTSTLANALTVQVSIQPMQIISGDSRAIPNRVAPDGTTPVTFWVLVKDPTALNQVSSVTIDLEQIGGRRAQEMAKDNGTQKQYSQFYTYRTTVAATTPTATDPIKLPVEVRKGTEVVSGTVEITVTKNVLKSIPPVIDQAYANPSTMLPDGESKGKISAQISDPDGVGTIKSVVADLGELGVGFVTLTPVGDAASIASQISGAFISEEFTVPKMTPEKAYTVTITAQDETGNIATKTLTINVSTAQNAPKFDAARSYIGPRKSVPRDGKTTFSIHAMVSDPDGINDVQSVTAYFGTSGITPMGFTMDSSVTKESTVKSALWNSGDISVPSVIPLGIQNVELVAVDNAGGTANLIMQFEVTDKDTLGSAPFINSDKAYTSPKIALNDGTTPITLYTFVRDDDENLESVVVNLANLGQVGPELPPDLGESGAVVAAPGAGSKACPAASTGIVCMTRGFKEGNLGQWFVLSGVTISQSVAASDKPYSVEVIATDMSGNVSRGQISVSVRDSLTATADKTPPSVVTSVPVGFGSVEVLFSKPLDATSLSASGSDFTITQSQDVNQKLNVFGTTIDASGTIVTVTTDAQQANVNYVLSVSSKVTDSAGIPMASGRNSQSGFMGFEDSDKSPVVDSIGPTDGETVEIDFQSNLRPTSVKLGEAAKGGNFDIKIEEAESNQSLAVKAVRFLDSGKSLEVKTDPQKSSTRYRVTITNVASAAGVQSRTPMTKFFKSINIQAIQKAAAVNSADLNGDGKVDFNDFTMFAYAFGEAAKAAASDSGAASKGLNPIAPPPDSTITHTSTPAGN